MSDGFLESVGTPAWFTAPDGTRLSARLAGPADAPPLVLVHGFSMAALVFSYQLGGPLAERFRVIAPDLRGHGMSEVGPDVSALAEQQTWAGDLQAAVDAFASRVPLIAGWSFGGRVLSAYIGAGGQAAGYIFINAVSEDVLPDGELPLGPGAAGFPDAIGEDDARAAAAVVGFVDAMFAKPPPSPMRDRILASAASVPRTVRRAMRGTKTSTRAKLAVLDVPVLAVHGTDDAITRQLASETTAEAAQDGQCIIWDGLGHVPFLEDPALFDAAVIEFAKRCGYVL